MELKFNYNWSSWNEIDSVLQSASNKEKGDLFELLSKYYFLYSFQYQNYYDNVWLGNDIPQKVLDELGLPKQDLGIDLIAKYGDEYHAIQCKYHGDKTKSVTYNEVSTFLSLICLFTKTYSRVYLLHS
jgi:predicted helicase